jgi:hypothetical protein
LKTTVIVLETEKDRQGQQLQHHQQHQQHPKQQHINTFGLMKILKTSGQPTKNYCK